MELVKNKPKSLFRIVGGEVKILRFEGASVGVPDQKSSFKQSLRNWWFNLSLCDATNIDAM